MKEPDQQQIVYNTNLEDSLQNNGTKLYDEEGLNEKRPAARNRLIEEPSLNNLNHDFEVYKESGSDIDYIEGSLEGENKNVRELDLAMCVSPSSNGSKMRSLWTNQMKS